MKFGLAKTVVLFTVLMIGACTSVATDQSSLKNPDGTWDYFNSYARKDASGIDTNVVIARTCDEKLTKCQVTSIAEFGDGGIAKVIGPALVMSAGFVGGEAVRRPDSTTVTNSGGSPTTTNTFDFCNHAVGGDCF